MKNKVGAKKGTLKRLFKMLFEFYPVLLPMVLVCVVLNAMISSGPRGVPTEYHCSRGTELADKGLGQRIRTDIKICFPAYCFLCFVIGCRICLFIWHGDHHAGVFEKASCENVQRNAVTCR